MSNPIKKSTITPEPAATPPAPPKPKSPAFGVEPGTLRGSAMQYSGAPAQDPDATLVDDVNKMGAKEYRNFLRIPGNRERVNAAFAARGKKNDK